MHPKRKKKLLWLIAALAGFSVVVALVLYALRAQANYFYDPTQIAAGQAPQNVRIRAGGMVVANTILRDSDNPLKISFKITDFKHTTSVTYEGILPDLFKENSGAVVQGKLSGELFVADEVLAKHDENYMPPEVAKSLKNKQEHKNVALSQTKTP